MDNHNAEYLSGLVKKFGKSLVLQRMLLFFLKMTKEVISEKRKKEGWVCGGWWRGDKVFKYMLQKVEKKELFREKAEFLDVTDH